MQYIKINVQISEQIVVQIKYAKHITLNVSKEKCSSTNSYNVILIGDLFNPKLHFFIQSAGPNKVNNISLQSVFP